MERVGATSAGTLQTLTIDDFTQAGVGLGRLDGQVILVEGTIPGDRVQVRLMHQARRHAVGKLVNMIEASPDRRRPPCILADRCGGCTLQAQSEAAQQRWKQHTVVETLQRIAHLSAPVPPLLVAPEGLGYRNRAIIPLERDPQGRLRAGFYRRGSHQIVNMNHCPVLDPRLDAMVSPLKTDLEDSGWPVNRHGAKGEPDAGLRHLALRIGRRSGECLITLIASHADLPGLPALAERWMARWPSLVGVTLNIQPQATNRLFGDQNHTVAGRNWLLEPFAGVQLQIGADTFFQVYSEQAERVVLLVQEALGAPRGLLLEGYCGIGTFSMPLALGGWSLLGIENHPHSVALARANAQRNGLSERCTFMEGDGAKLLDQALESQTPSAVLLDPPRKGLPEAVVASLLRHRPRQIVYLSCDPATLARDLGRLARDGGYPIARVQPIDFFPNTTHVETLVTLQLP